MLTLVVEDEVVLSRNLAQTLEDAGFEVVCAESARDAIACVDKLELAGRSLQLAILDFQLPDGTGVEVARELAKRRPVPAMVAISDKARWTDGFALREAGVRGCIPKPLDLETFMTTVQVILEAEVNLAPQVAGLVGKHAFHDVLRGVRRVLAEQALANANGNKTKAAEQLEVTRQAVQAMVRDLELDSSPPHRHRSTELTDQEPNHEIHWGRTTRVDEGSR